MGGEGAVRQVDLDLALQWDGGGRADGCAGLVLQEAIPPGAERKWVLRFQAGRTELQAVSGCCKACLHGSAQGSFCRRKCLHRAFQAAKKNILQPGLRVQEYFRRRIQADRQGGFQSVFRLYQVEEQRLLIGNSELGRGRRGGSAEVGDKIGDSEVGLVPDAGDDWRV